MEVVIEYNVEEGNRLGGIREGKGCKSRSLERHSGCTMMYIPTDRFEGALVPSAPIIQHSYIYAA